MPIKAKPIDPERARLAARGQWGQKQQESTLRMTESRMSAVTGMQNGGRARSSSTSGSSSSSSSTSSSYRSCSSWGRYQHHHGGNDRQKHKRNSVEPAFITTTLVNDCKGEMSDSDPELYRAARERTVRFLYSSGRPVNKTNNNAGNKSCLAVNKEGCNVVVKGLETESTGPSAVNGAELKSSVNVKSQDLKQEGECFEKTVDGGSENDKNTTRSPLASLPIVQGALQGVQGAAESELERDFARLMNLFAFDLEKERERQEQKSKNNTQTTGRYKSNDDVDGSHEPHLQSEASKTHVYQPRTFAELQERALLQLYAASQAEDSDKCFIATEHMAEAFTLAALEATRDGLPVEGFANTAVAKTESSGNIWNRQPDGVPLNLLELVASERARRNARAAFDQRRDEGKGLPLDYNTDALLYSDADILAANAEESLNRFLSSVRCIEASVRNRHVIEELGCFLYEHHKLFIPTRQDSEPTGDLVREFSHEAFAVYERYSTSVSAFITRLLYKNVPNFNMEEFVVALYDVNYYGDGDDAGDGEYVSMDVLSYPAWRLLQSVSSFDQFSMFMDDFIAEEYGVEVAVYTKDNVSNGGDMNITRCHEDDAVVLAGARGIRALLMRTKVRARKRVTPLNDYPPQVVPSTADGDNNNSGSGVLLSRNDCTDDVPLSHQEEEKEHQQRNLSATEEPHVRSDSTFTLPLRSRPAVSTLSHTPLLNTPSSTPSSRMEMSQCSSRSYDTKNCFIRSKKGLRRPDAVPGRNLPPLRVGEMSIGESVFSKVEPKLSLNSEPSAPLLDGSNTVPPIAGRSTISGDTHRSIVANMPDVFVSPPSVGVNRSQKKEGTDARTRKGAQNGAVTCDAPATTKLRKKVTK